MNRFLPNLWLFLMIVGRRTSTGWMGPIRAFKVAFCCGGKR